MATRNEIAVAGVKHALPWSSAAKAFGARLDRAAAAEQTNLLSLNATIEAARTDEVAAAIGAMPMVRPRQMVPSDRA